MKKFALLVTISSAGFLTGCQTWWDEHSRSSYPYPSRIELPAASGTDSGSSGGGRSRGHRQYVPNQAKYDLIKQNQMLRADTIGEHIKKKDGEGTGTASVEKLDINAGTTTESTTVKKEAVTEPAKKVVEENKDKVSLNKE